MSPALDDLPTRKVLRVLKKAGFDHVRTRGSHAFYRHPDGRVVVVPLHSTIKRGTLGGILEIIGMTSREFLEML